MPEIYRNVVKTFAWISILVELSKGRELTGYDILVHIRKFGLEVSAGTIYYQLGVFEKAGLIRAKTKIRVHAEKTVYVITPKGVKAFNEFKKKWQKPLAYVQENLHIKK